MINLNNIKNIFFDLGGVLLNIDFKKTYDAFADLGIPEAHALNDRPEVLQLFLDLECGRYSPEGFLGKFRELIPDVDFRKIAQVPDQVRDDGRGSLHAPATDEAIIDAFNALLLDFPAERIAKVQEVASKYRCFLLSNTNAIHAQCYNARLKENFGIESLDHLLEKAFYSHDLGFRKPDKQIYLKALELANVKAEESLFIDDNLENVEAAREVGMKAVQVDEEYTVLDLFNV